MGLEVGNAPVLGPQVGPGGFKAFVENAVVGAELADALFECVVLGGDPLDGILCPFGFQIADTPEEFADAGALGVDLGVGGLKRIFGLRARSRQVSSRELSVSTKSRRRWSPACWMASATAAFASGLV